jgi:hypothetical protein
MDCRRWNAREASQLPNKLTFVRPSLSRPLTIFMRKDTRKRGVPAVRHLRLAKSQCYSNQLPIGRWAFPLEERSIPTHRRPCPRQMSIYWQSCDWLARDKYFGVEFWWTLVKPFTNKPNALDPDCLNIPNWQLKHRIETLWSPEISQLFQREANRVITS